MLKTVPPVRAQRAKEVPGLPEPTTVLLGTTVDLENYGN